MHTFLKNSLLIILSKNSVTYLFKEAIFLMTKLFTPPFIHHRYLVNNLLPATTERFLLVCYLIQTIRYILSLYNTFYLIRGPYCFKLENKFLMHKDIAESQKKLPNKFPPSSYQPNNVA